MNSNLTPEETYYTWMEAFIKAISTLPDIDLQGVFAALTELCKLFRICKGVTTFYEDQEKEARDEGEVFVCYDSGEAGEPISVRRLVTSAGTVVTCVVYQTGDVAPLSPLERERVELIQQIIITFTSQSRLQKIVEKMAYWDMDGYPNLSSFFRELSERIADCALSDSAVIRLNLRHFSGINQQLGREAGNRVMMAFYQCLSQRLGRRGFLARLGGDNFVGICEASTLESALELLRGVHILYDPRTKSAYRPDASLDYALSPYEDLVISAVAGVYVLPNGFLFRNPGDIMDPVTAAYQAAKNGRVDDIVFYSEEIRQRKARIVSVQEAFSHAIEHEDLLVYYQPKVNINDNTLIGAEALCRWRQNGRIVMPGEFIPILEQGSDICKLDFYMLDHVCKDIRRWLDRDMPVVRISVNMSRRHMIDPNLFETIVGIIDRNNVPHRYIEIELTETVTEVEFQALKRVVTQLQGAGIFTSVDDFGVGYSSMNLIKEIPWNVLKLDKSLLFSRDHKNRVSMMLRHIIAMAHEIDMECVAEGVETREQLELLHMFGCQIAQGFYFDKPLPVAEFEIRMKIGLYQP